MIRHILALLLLLGAACAQDSPAIRAYVTAHQRDILREYVDLLSIPNLASDSANIRKNAEHVAAMLKRRGVEARLLEAAGPPIVYGELPAPGARHTLIVYAHYDGQPVDPAQWSTPPWSPVLRDASGKEVALDAAPPEIPGEWRLYARSAGDDKAPIQAVVAALDALRAAGARPTINLKFFFEGEEEAGSPHLGDAAQKYAGLLRADAWLFCDGPINQTRRMQLYFGARGMRGLEMTLYGPARSLHSGHYGNWAPNPAALMANLLSSMRDENARVRIPGFYDDVRPLTDTEKQAIAAMPEVDTQMRRELALAWTEAEPESLPMRIMAPGLNVRGIDSGHVGDKAQNAIPTEARASLDFRLVPDQKPERIRQLVEDHIRRQGFTIVHQPPTLDDRRAHARIALLQWDAGYPASRTPIDLPVSRAMIATLEQTLGAPIVKMPMLGGSVPMYLFNDHLHTPVIGLPIVNHDNNQHAANENLRLQNLWDGIVVFAGLFSNLETNWGR